jgi:zinc protease
LQSAKHFKMKNTLLFLIRQRIAVLLIVLFPLQYLQAQDRLEQTIPIDEKIRIGKLENGLRYYIRKNKKPENRVEMRLAVNAGSVLEDDDQQGLAHFVEHMAFNGTRNFAKNDLVKYLQSVGVQFGPEINAYTSFDETVYMLTLPTDSARIVEKGYQIMEDWAHNLTFDDAEIDKERGVIIEEWRLGRGPMQRMEDKFFPVVFKGSQYGNRLPIGKKEIIEGAPHEKIKKFYTDWYRPDLMAFAIVGDIDPDAVEKSIREHFGKLQMPVNPRPRNRFKIPDQPGTTAVVATDKEAPYTLIQVICKNDPPDYLKLKDYRESVALQLVSSMLNQRFDELKEQANPPLLYSGVQYGMLGTREKSALQMVAMVNETGVPNGLQAIITETERAFRFGFTPGELERQKKQLLSFYESAYNERDKTDSKDLVAEYLRNFLTNEPIPGIEFEYEFIKEYLNGISIEEINQLSRNLFKHDNRVVMVMGPQKAGIVLPGEDQVLALISQTENLDIKAYIDKASGKQLMAEKPKRGRIILSKKNDALGVVEMNLSNGAKVILKPTNFKNDEILLSAYSPGGYSLYELADHQSAVNAADVVGQCGLDDYSPSDLNKLLAGKVVSVSPYINAYYEGVNGSAAPADFETMLQLVYLGFTQPRKDKQLFTSFINQQKGVIKNLLADPGNYFSDQFNRIKAQNNPNADFIPTEADIDRIDYDRVFEIYNDRFSDASGFTFFIVGSFKIDSIKPFIETYLASLPTLKKPENWKDMGIRPPAKKVDKAIYKGKDPKSIVAVYLEVNEPWDLLESHMFSSLGQLLEIKYTEVLREQMSGIYGMGVNVSLVKIPYNHLEVGFKIPCSPQNAAILTKAAFNEIRKIQKEGVSADDLIKVKEAQRREMESNLKENSFWIGQLVNSYRLDDPGLITQVASRIDAVTSERLQAAAKKINLKSYVRVVLYPEK